MKNMIRFAVAVMWFVVGVQSLSSQTRVPEVPKYLPIGEAFPPPNTLLRIDIGYDDPTHGSRPLHTNVFYNAAMGSIEDAVRQEVAKLVERFVPQTGTEIYNYGIDVGIDQIMGVVKYPLWENDQRPIGSHQWEPYKLVQVNGKWTFPPEALNVVIGYQSYLGIYAKGLSEVERFQWTDEDAGLYYQEFSPNGIDDVTCSQYPGGYAYDGPDMLQMPIGFAYPGYYIREYPGYVPPKGYYKLYFGDDKALWAKYDLTTGRKIGSNEPVLKLAPIEVTGKATGSVKQVTQRVMQLSVTGPAGKVVTVEFTNKLGGQWAPLKVLTLTYGSGELVDDEWSPTNSSRFYRVRLGN